MRQPGNRERGIALIATLLALLVFSLMAIGFYFLVTGEQRVAVSDRDNTVAFYAAEGGLEKMSADLAALFFAVASPSPTQVNNLTNATQLAALTTTMPGVAYPVYTISFNTNSSGTIISSVSTIGGTGPLNGLQGIITPFTLSVVAQSANNTEVKLTRVVQEVAVPVFQFGIFSDNDLSFFAGPNFNFGGRVHTNGNLFVAEGNGSTLTLGDKVTAYQDVIRQQLSNGWATSSNYTGTVNAITAPGVFRALGSAEGSVIGGPGSGVNPAWKNLSLTTYNANIRNGKTGAKKLNLALALAGDTPVQIIRRPPTGESPTSVTGQARLYNQASLRITLSDTQAKLPGGTGGLSLDADPYTVDACHPPVALSPGKTGTANGTPDSSTYKSDDFLSPPQTPLIGGWIKAEIQLNATPGTWSDVTAEILAQGIEQPVPPATSCATGGITYYPIIRLEKQMPADLCVNCTFTNSPYDYIPITLYDAREGEVRDNTAASSPVSDALMGVMHLIEVDTQNLQRWFACNYTGTGQTGACNGTNALNASGYIMYVSDRRTNKDSGGNETGEFGYEDILNPAAANGAPNSALDTGEDVNGNGTLETYGGTPVLVTGALTPLNSTANPVTTRVTPAQAQKNRPIFFRRAVRLVNGALGKVPPLASANCTSTTAGGFSLAAENPIYVLGDYNSNSTGDGFNDNLATPACHVPAAVMGDAVTFLSNAWFDEASFNVPDIFWPSGGNCGSTFNRCAATTWYRVAVISGKNLAFPRPTFAGVAQDFGTDGGTHNFLRYIENWGGQALNYRGSIVSFYIARQAIGIYKCCNKVYSPPTRGYNFDTDFQTIAKLPPGTPRFTDVNALSFHQAVLPLE